MSSSASIEKKKVEDFTEEHSTDGLKLRSTHTKKVISSKDADATLKFIETYDSEIPEITEAEERKLSRKVTWIVVSLVAFTNLLLYADKATLSYASTFELWDDTHLTQNRYNNSSTLFYVGYIVGQLNLFLVQKLPLSKLLTAITFLWTMIIFLHCTAHNYQAIYALRFFLGFVESVAIPILNTTMGQFLTNTEKAATAPVFYSFCMGVTIPVGFIAFGVLHIDNPPIALWKIFFIIIGCCTFVNSLLIFFIYPNNPTDAKFLSIKERMWVIRRVQRTTGASIEQKTFKKYQLVEALKDPISWLFALFFLLQQLANNLTYQQNLLFENMGNLSNLDTTLVSVASGGFGALMGLLATLLLFRVHNFTAFSVVLFTIPSFVGSIGAVSIAWNHKTAILAFLCLASPAFGVPWMLMFSWSSTTCSGYTKKMTRYAMVMVGYAVANLISPQLWQEKDGPRYYPAWIVQIVLSFTMAPALAIVIWFILNKRNKERSAKKADASDEGVGIVEESDGQQVKVNVAALDLTDLENEEFIYPL
ncbi:unnamed protein product [Ambrosiozyma monospora]|uniref:Unnamed protein product n=1 Tax=Ambrosiozyma monospora TaxID=43982 RepID=A0A9W7DCS6_AMBMO|nr:unnamed protein product [Ambrosiozyma monospora]